MKYYINLIKKFFSFHVVDKRQLIELIIAIIFRNVAELLIPLASSLVVDAATEENYGQAGIFVIFFFASTVAYAGSRHWSYVAYRKNALFIHDTLQREVLDKTVALDQDYTTRIPHSEIINTSGQDITSCQRIPDYLFELVAKIVNIIVDTFVLFFVDNIIGAIAIFFTFISLVIFISHMKKRDYYANQRRIHQDEISGLMMQTIDGYKEVHSFNLDSNLRTVLEKEKKEWVRLYKKQRIHNDLGESATPLLQGIARIVAYIVAGTLILNGKYNVATLVLVMGYFEEMHNSYNSATDIIFNLTKSSVGILRVHRLLNYKPTHKTSFGKNDNDDIKGKVSFENVSFTYGRKPLMKNVSFTIEPSSLTGIVGKSGSGKSTIFRLLLRLYKPTRGKITIDDKNIKDYNKEVYATNVSIVNQKPFVFDLSIRENLNMVDSNIEHQIAACKKAGIHDFIMNLEKGYDTVLVADGANLSAGHKQLLSLARTLLSRSEVLLFDEVTSALDNDTTKQIIDVLKSLKKDHTVLVITHKPEVMRAMDELIVIDNGKMVGRGTHKNLLHNKFYQLLQK